MVSFVFNTNIQNLVRAKLLTHTMQTSMLATVQSFVLSDPITLIGMTAILYGFEVRIA